MLEPEPGVMMRQATFLTALTLVLASASACRSDEEAQQASGATTLVWGGEAWAVAVDDTSVYWVDSWNVMRVGLEGGEPQLLAKNQDGPHRIVAYGAEVYWTNHGWTGPDAGSLMASPKGGGGPGTKVWNLHKPTHLAVDATGQYWVSRADQTIESSPRGVLASGQADVSSIAVDGTSVYWSKRDGTVMKVGVHGGTPITLASGQASANAIAVDGTSVYWTSNEGTVMKVGVEGGSPIMLASEQSSPSAIAVDATHVYWTNDGLRLEGGVAQYSGSIMKVAKDGGPPVTLFAAQDLPTSIAVGKSCVVWVSLGGAIMKGPK
jgi:hypothetical protein